MTSSSHVEEGKRKAGPDRLKRLHIMIRECRKKGVYEWDQVMIEENESRRQQESGLGKGGI